MHARQTYRYESVGSFLASIAAKKCVNPANTAIARSCDEQSGDWIGLPHGTWTTARVAQLVRDGWHDGLARVQRDMAALEAPLGNVLRRRQRWGADGDELDQQRVWTGNLETAWRGPRRVAVRAPLRVRLVCQTNALADVDADALFWRGAAVARLVDSLTEAGYNCEVQAHGFARVLASTGKGGIFHETIVVKAANAPLVPLDIASTCAMPAFFRSLILAHRALYSTVALANSVSATLPETLDDCDTSGVDLVFLATSTIESRDAAQAWISAAVAQIESQQAAA